LHQRVQPNWLSPVCPPLAILAALGAEANAFAGALDRVAVFCRRHAVWIALVIVGLPSLQAATGLLPLGSRDPTARRSTIGWSELAAKIDEVRSAWGAKAVLATSYRLASPLRFYLPPATPVVAAGEPVRWVNAPEHASELLDGPLLYVNFSGEPVETGLGYATVRQVATLPRMRRGTAIDYFDLYLVESREPGGSPMNIISAVSRGLGSHLRRRPAMNPDTALNAVVDHATRPFRDDDAISPEALAERSR
jgi:hypothetical protein